MDATPLREAYGAFQDAARSGPFTTPADQSRWSADLIVAHVIAIDQLFAGLLTEALAGRAPGFDNRAGIRAAHLRAIVAATGGEDRLLATARQTAAVVCALWEAVDEGAASRPVQAFIQSGGAVRLDTTCPLSFLMEGQARGHVPGHAEQLRRLRAV